MSDSVVFLETELKMPLMKLPVRSTFVSVGENGILISPGSQLEPVQFKGISKVTDLVGTNLFHCAGIKKATEQFPNAKRWGPMGCMQSKPDLQWTGELSAESWPYQKELPMVFLQGMPKVNEVVFVHRDSKSLIVSDLCFNIQDAKGIGPMLILSMFGTYNRFAVSRFFARFVSDKVALEKSLNELFSYDFDKIVMGHGYNLENGAKDLLRKALVDRGLYTGRLN